MMGVGPTSQAWEARILPMYYTRVLRIYFIRNFADCQENVGVFTQITPFPAFFAFLAIFYT